jgi:FdhE protein
MIAGTPLDSLKRQCPEWVPWLAVVEEVVREGDSPDWDRVIPATIESRGARVPLLAGASLGMERRVVGRLLQRLVRRAAASETMATLQRGIPSDVDALALFAASLDQETDRIRQIATALAVDADAMQAVVALLPVPFLQACNRKWARLKPESWTHGYCPVCGSWPAFAEVRGIERSRYFRCGRCGSEWYARALVCAFCGVADHQKLTSLVPARSDVHAVIEACNGCRGYVKAFTRLQGCPPGGVMIEDLASVDLDMAALEHGYARPNGTGHRLDVTVTEPSRRRGFFGWNA